MKLIKGHNHQNKIIQIVKSYDFDFVIDCIEKELSNGIVIAYNNQNTYQVGIDERQIENKKEYRKAIFFGRLFLCGTELDVADVITDMDTLQEYLQSYTLICLSFKELIQFSANNIVYNVT